MTAADEANINTAISNILALIVEITARPRPNYSDQGRSVSMGEYLSILTGRVKELRQMKSQIRFIWLGTNYHETAGPGAGVNTLPPVPEWLGGYLD